jgi:transcriptional regulator with XRE-family HTH domain
MNLTKLSKLIQDLAGSGSIADLARKMDIKPGTLRTYARNDGGYPSVETLMAIADYMEIGLDELVRMLEEEEKRRVITAKEQGGVYRIVKVEDVVHAIDDWPLSEQLSLVEKIVNRTKSAIAV